MSQSIPLHEELLDLQKTFRKSAQDVQFFLEEVSDENFNTRPASGRWSVAECLEHLNRTGKYVTVEIEKSISIGIKKSRAGDPPFTYGWFNRFFINYMKPGSAIKAPAPKIYKPVNRSDYDRTQTLAAYTDLQEWYCELIERANGLDLKRIKVRSPALPVLRLSLGALFHAMAAHQERHIAQAKRTHQQIQSMP